MDQVIADEKLDITLVDRGLFDLEALGEFDTVLFLGLIYHFRNPQYALDSLSVLTKEHLFVSSQTIAGDDLTMVNRRSESQLGRKTSRHTALKGWHPTRPLLVRMIEWAGFRNVLPLSNPDINYPDKPKFHTNSAYYRAIKDHNVDRDAANRIFL
ncbi:MAG: hypothetical protein Kilf2KO_44710 [Rhodospirillales bacterium]